MGACYGNGSGFNVNGASCMLGQNSPQMQVNWIEHTFKCFLENRF